MLEIPLFVLGRGISFEQSRSPGRHRPLRTPSCLLTLFEVRVDHESTVDTACRHKTDGRGRRVHRPAPTVAGSHHVALPFISKVIQIGFNAALNNRGSSNPLIPITRFGKSEQTRRLADSDRRGYLFSRESASYEMPEPEYDSFEDYSLTSYQPYQSRNDLRYSTRPENDVSLETAPVGRINSNNYVETVPSSSTSSRRTYSNYRQPYSARGPTYLGQGQSRKYYRTENDDSSLELSSLEGNNPEDASREEADAIFSLIEKSFNRRGQNRKYYREGNSLSADASLGLKSPTLTNDSPLTRGFNRKSNGNSRTSLRDESFPNDDKTGQLTFLRLSSLEDLNLESPLIHSRNFLKFSLSPNNKVTHDEGIASDLSELLSETLGELNFVPVSLRMRRTGPSSNKYSRREKGLSAKEDDLTNPSDLRLGSLDIINSELPIHRYSEPAYRSSKKNLRRHWNNKAALIKQFDEDTAKTLVPDHEGNRKKLLNSRKNGNQNNNRDDDFSDEFSLDTLFAFKKESHDDTTNLDDNLSSDLSVLSSTNQDNFNPKSSLLRSSDEIESKPTTDILKLEYNWIDVLRPKNKTEDLRSHTQLGNGEKKHATKDSTDILQLKYPWTDVLSPSKNNTGGLRSLTQLKNGEQEDKTKDSSDPLHLEFPWNDGLSPGSNKSGKSKSNSPEQKDASKDTTDTLRLEYPLNDSLTPENNKSSKQSGVRSKSLLRSPKKEDNVKDTTDTLYLEYENLEFPRSNELSTVNKPSSKQSVIPGLRSKSQLRSPKQKDEKKDSTDVLHLEYPWNDQLSPDNNKSKELRSHDQEDNVKDTTDVIHLEFPWNDENKNGTDSRQDKEPKDELKLELPQNGKTNLDKPSSKKTAVRIPDPFYVHPYLRNRNIKKHPNYFGRSYDDFSEGVRLENNKNSPLKRSNSPSRRSNRRLMDSKILRVLPIARAGPENNKIFLDSVSVESPIAVITFPSDRIHGLRVRTRRQNNETPPLVTSTERPK